MAGSRRSPRNLGNTAPPDIQGPAPKSKARSFRKPRVSRTPSPEMEEEPESPPSPPRIKRLVRISSVSAPATPLRQSSPLKRGMVDRDVQEEAGDEDAELTSVKRRLRSFLPVSPRPRGGSRKRGAVKHSNVEWTANKKALIAAKKAKAKPTSDSDVDNPLPEEQMLRIEKIIKKEDGAVLTQVPRRLFEPLHKFAYQKSPLKNVFGSDGVDKFDEDDNDNDEFSMESRRPVILIPSSDIEVIDDDDKSDFENKNPQYYDLRPKRAKDKGKGKQTDEADHAQPETTRNNRARTSVLRDPFTDLLQDEGENDHLATPDLATVEDQATTVIDEDAIAGSLNARDKGPFVYVRHNATTDDKIPNVCAFNDLREMNVAGMTGFYDKLIPYLPGSIDFAGLTDKIIVMRLQSVFHKFSGSAQKVVRDLVTFQGVDGIVNLARANIFSNKLTWRSLKGSDILHVGDVPVMSYMMGFVKSSNILYPVSLGATVYEHTQVVLMPLIHEWDRLAAAISHLANKKVISLNCFKGGVNIHSRTRAASNQGSASSSNAGRYESITAPAYVSPSSPSKSSTSSANIIKEPTDPIPLYDLSDKPFDPRVDFATIHTRGDNLDTEVPPSEFALVTFHISKYFDLKRDIWTADLSLQWVAVLTPPIL